MSMISVQNLTFSYDGSYDNIFEDVSFQIYTDWKLGVTSRNGIGKTTFFKLLIKKYEYKGKILSSVNFGYCWSKSLSMINDSVLLFMYRNSLSYIRL